MTPPKLQPFVVRWYINAYAWAYQQANSNPGLRTHFTNRMELYERMYLSLSTPITINELLP